MSWWSRHAEVKSPNGGCTFCAGEKWRTVAKNWERLYRSARADATELEKTVSLNLTRIAELEEENAKLFDERNEYYSRLILHRPLPGEWTYEEMQRQRDEWKAKYLGGLDLQLEHLEAAAEEAAEWRRKYEDVVAGWSRWSGPSQKEFDSLQSDRDLWRNQCELWQRHGRKLEQKIESVREVLDQ